MSKLEVVGWIWTNVQIR